MRVPSGSASYTSHQSTTPTVEDTKKIRRLAWFPYSLDYAQMLTPNAHPDVRNNASAIQSPTTILPGSMILELLSVELKTEFIDLRL